MDAGGGGGILSMYTFKFHHLDNLLSAVKLIDDNGGKIISIVRSSAKEKHILPQDDYVLTYEAEMEQDFFEYT